MTPELQNSLYERYPKIFRQKDMSIQETCMCWGICTGDGWYDIINMLCNAIQHRIESKSNSELPIQSVEATQVKEKWGSLRFYYEGGDEYIEGLVSMAELLSSVTCLSCGASTADRQERRNICSNCLTTRIDRL
tara:strand:+ start:2091 stop:2492 length:402 start_codon:yes stop_codon:yes gene_type:complete